jgi:hypothetical protein
MESKELRIGNFINGSIEVLEIDQYGITGFYDEGMGGMNYNEYGCLIEDARPIPLNEKWLDDFGFREVNGHLGKGYTKGRMFLEYSFIGFLFKNDMISDKIRIDSVHKLQNLFYELLGKDLKLSRNA